MPAVGTRDMDRRTFCATTAAGITATLVGCVGTTTDAEPETQTPTDAEPTARPHDLYVVNDTTTTEVATVRVVNGGGTTVVDGRYELPSERGIRFEHVGVRKAAYTVELAIDSTALEPLTWETPSCASADRAPRGFRNGYVRVREAGSGGLRATVTVDGCDEIVGPKYPTGPAHGFRVAA